MPSGVHDPSSRDKREGEPRSAISRLEQLRGRVERLPKTRLAIGLLVFTWLSLSALLALDFRPLVAFGLQKDKQAYEVGGVAQNDVYAPHSVTYIDPVATEKAKADAVAKVPEVYKQDMSVPPTVANSVHSFFNRVREIRKSKADVDTRTAQILNAAPFYIPDGVARLLLFVKDNEVDDVERYVTENLAELYNSTAVADDGLNQMPAAVIGLSEGRTRLSDAARRDASGDVGTLVDVLSRGFLKPDYVVDRSATSNAREKALAGVQPVTNSILQGERVITRGQVVNKEDMAKLEALGLVKRSSPWTVFMGVGLVMATEMGIAWYFLQRFGQRILKHNAQVKLLLAALLTVLFTALAQVFALASLNTYLIPLAGLGILGTLLLGPRMAFLMVVITSVNVGMIAGNDFFLSVALLLSSAFAIYAVVKVKSRSELLRAGLLVTLVMMLVTFASSLIAGGDLQTGATQALWGLGNGLLSLMIAMVLLPILESTFNILTPMRLLELSDPSNPLLQTLLRKAPGTFSHAMQVGNLAESAAERIGANTLLARVGAYYHDIGKMEHPAYFIENQIAQVNPHNSLSPALSAKVIQRHVKEGLDIGRAWNLPQEVMDIIAQHHGTTRVEYFYRKALENALPGVAVSEEDFRHVGGRPQSKEAGILMLADSIEAAVKSMEKPTPKRIQDVVERIIQKKIEDGQFAESELTMKEIHEVGYAIKDALIGFLGPRIAYPEEPLIETAKNPT